MTRATAVALLGAALLAGCGEEKPARPDEPRPIDRRLLAAAYENDVATARRLVEDGADVNAKDESQQSAYLIATSEMGDDPRLLDLTLDAGADIEAKDGYNGTGLIRAAERGYSTIVVRAGLTPTIRSSDGRARLGHISRQGSPALRCDLGSPPTRPRG